MKKEIFLDHASTTPIAKQVLNEIIKNTKDYANPSSKHDLGQKVKKKIENAREKISISLGCDSKEIFFTSGGTEGNNTIIKGLAEKNPEKKHIIISEIEHPSVIEPCNKLKKKGYLIDKISVDKQGQVNLEELKSKINQNTLLVSIMHVNNEIGTIQPIEEIAKICRERQVYFHSDMVQSLGKININLKKTNLDFASFSGHKINALKGIGFIYIKKGVEIEPLICGGGQEGGIRSGTENFLGILSLPTALNLKRQTKSITKDRDYIIKEILKIPGTILNGSKENRIYNNINVSFYGIEGESLMMLLSKEGISVSTGSACSSNKLTESHVLRAIGLDEMYLNGSIRITIDELTKEEILYIASSIKKSVKKLQDISPFKYNSTKQKEAK
jgi:cysteine desulfurase